VPNTDQATTEPTEKKSKAPKFMTLDRFFKTPPVNVPAKDGSKRKLTIQHRVGSDGGSYSIEKLMDKTGLEKELLAIGVKLEKKFHDRKTFEKFFNIAHKDFVSRLRAWVNMYRKYLIEFYAPQSIRPIMNFLPIDDPKKRELFISGFVDVNTLSPVFGEFSDITLALEVKNAHLKSAVDEYRENQKIAKAAMALPGVNKDLQHRLTQVATGTIDRAMLLERVTEEASK
jgi:hypothetical protein